MKENGEEKENNKQRNLFRKQLFHPIVSTNRIRKTENKPPTAVGCEAITWFPPFDRKSRIINNTPFDVGSTTEILCKN